MKVVVSKPELATEISKAIFVRFPSKIKVDRAVQTSLDWIAAIRIDDIYAIEKTRRSFFRSVKVI